MRRSPPVAHDPDADRDRALRLVPVSRETAERFALYADLLRRWQGVKNLVGPATLDQVWTRHIADGAQLVDVVPGARTWADMGSGAGLPGLVIAIRLAGEPGARVHLIEANARKCAFLREAARACGAPAIVHQARVEDVVAGLGPVDAVTARALAPLRHLLALGDTLLQGGALGVFLKGRDEVDGLRASGNGAMTEVLPSRTSPEGRVVLVRSGAGVIAPPDGEGSKP